MRLSDIAATAILIAVLIMVACGDDKDIAPTQPQTLAEKLAAMPGATVTELDPPQGFTRAFEVILPQPVDHDNPSGPKFSQRIFITHRDEKAPTVFVTWGYMVGLNNIFPPTTFLNANQIYMDHRYFGDAVTDPIDWQYLTAEQAAEDCHRVAHLLSGIYAGPWVSYGVSKGGVAALFHRRYYPDDVDATIAQVTPLSMDTADARYDDFLLDEVGDADCRERLIGFQRLALSLEDSLLPLYENYATDNQLSFRYGLQTAFEINTLELLFSYWQYGPQDCTALPDSSNSVQEVFDFLQYQNDISWLSDPSMDMMAPAWYQMFTELGYYRLIDDHVADLLQSPHHLSYSLFFPEGAPRSYDPSGTQDLIQWLQNEGDNILYIYGEYDPYTSCGVDLNGSANALKITLPDENHLAGFFGYGPYETEVHDSLESWLGVIIDGGASPTRSNQRDLIRIMRSL